MSAGVQKRYRRVLTLRRDREPRPYRPRPFPAIYAALLVAGVIGTAGVYLLLLWLIPGAKANRLDVAKTALLVVGGSGAVAGLYVAYRKQRTDEANHIRDQDKLFTERYTQAIAQLGNTAAAVRLGGVYALARIADDSERDGQTCMEVLCAYLCIPYDPNTADPGEVKVRAAAQATVFARLRPDHKSFWANAVVDLSGARLTNVSLRHAKTAGAYFVDTEFDGICEFDHTAFDGGAIFRGAHFHQGNEVDFQGALFGWANFDGVKFDRAVRFDDVQINGVTGFANVEFGGDASFKNTRFAMGAAFRESRFAGSASFNGATFTKITHFTDAHFAATTSFDHVTFGEAVWFYRSVFPDPPPSFTRAMFLGERLSVWPDGFAPPDAARNPPGVPAKP
ncbi:pentapeptide repeat-containing protein [Catenulispora pinisilvae]|uniref:pentapeptide repeat-containing protein n=1 Tax=Catenulispora pinisilvae TaxID=2705253 RepID=UPI001891D4C8|nr:pentapeptide repeat-containing protein [Catenulispora pinisilvae]